MDARWTANQLYPADYNFLSLRAYNITAFGPAPVDFQSLNCPQCGGTLPRQAIWRTVCCPFCGATVTRSDSVVDTGRFHQAFRRFLGDAASADAACGKRRYRVLRLLYQGPSARVVLARRCTRLAEHAVLKQAAGGKLEREYDVLKQLQSDTSPGSAYYTQRLPAPLALGSDGGGTTLATRHLPGYWGSLADVGQAYARGLDPRHMVWMWRRTLEVLAHVHAIGWRHGRVAPEHLLVHPADHGIVLTGWSDANRHGDPARDLMQSAWSMRALLAGQGAGAIAPAIPASTPAVLADVLQRACADHGWVQGLGAQGIHSTLTAAAAAAFGPPRFVPFQPQP